MADQLQLRRGTTAQIAAFTGAQGEVIVDTDKDTLVVQDGATAGGFPLATEEGLVDGTFYFNDDVAGGSIANSYILSPKANTNTPTVYMDGQQFGFVTANANTGPSTATFSGLGVRSLKYPGGIDPVAGQINGRVYLIYDATNGWFEIQSAIDYLNTVRINVASTAIVNLTTSAPFSRQIQITGTTTINSFVVGSGECFFVRFENSLTLTNSASLVTQTGANIVTVAGDTCIIRSTAANVVEILSYCRVQRLTQGTSITTSSGTSHDFTGIPSWAKKITVNLRDCSTNGASSLLLRVGAGSVQTTGYLSVSISENNTTQASVNDLTGFVMFATAAANANQGAITLYNVSGNQWVSDHQLYNTTNTTCHGAGGVTLSGTLDRVRLTTIGGTDTFDGGIINIIYEG